MKDRSAKDRGNRQNSIAAMTAVALLFVAALAIMLEFYSLPSDVTRPGTVIFLGALTVLGVQAVTVVSNRRERGEKTLFPKIKLGRPSTDLREKDVSEIVRLLEGAVGEQIVTAKELVRSLRGVLQTRDKLNAELVALQTRTSGTEVEAPKGSRTTSQASSSSEDASRYRKVLDEIAPLTESDAAPKDLDAVKRLVSKIAPLVKTGYAIGSDVKRNYMWLGRVFDRLLEPDCERPRTQAKFDSAVSSLAQDIHRGRKLFPELQGKLQELTEALGAANATTAKTRSELLEISARCTSLSCSEQHAISEAAQLRSEVQNLRQTNSALETNLARVSGTSSDLTTRLGNMQRMYEEAKAHAEKTDSKTSELEQQHAELNRIVTEYRAESARLRSEFESTRNVLTEQVADLTCREQLATERATQLSQEVDTLRGEKCSLADGLTRAIESAASLETRLEETERSLANERCRAAELTTLIESQGTRLAELDSQVAATQAELEDLRTRAIEWERLSRLDFAEFVLEAQEVFFAILGYTSYVAVYQSSRQLDQRDPRRVSSDQYYKKVVTPMLKHLAVTQHEKLAECGKLTVDLVEPILVAVEEQFRLVLDLARKGALNQNGLTLVRQRSNEVVSANTRDVLRGYLDTADHALLDVAFAVR